MKKSKTRTALLIFVVSLFLTGCASKPSGEHRFSSAKSMTVIFSQQRKLNIEPCGCSLGQLGGLEREYNYLAKLRSSGVEPLYLVGSSGFVPEDKFTAKDKKRYALKAQTITEALAKFKINAYIPDQSDLAIGLKEIQGLSRRFGIPFVSSNLVDSRSAKPLFLQRLEVPHAGGKLLVLGLSGTPTFENQETRRAKVLPSSEVLKRELAAVENHVVVVVHSLDQEDVLDLMKAYPQVSLWLGGNRTVLPDEVFQHSKTALSAEVQGWGRSLLRVDLEPKFPVIELYQEEQRRLQLSRFRVLEARKKTLDRGVASDADQLISLDRRLNLISGLTEKPVEQATHYRFERIDLGSDYNGKNELDKLLESSRRSLNGAAE